MEKYKNISYKIGLYFVLIFGIYLSTKLYLSSNVFEDDECRMALAMMGKSIWQMFLPLGAFSSTPIFMSISKIIADITNYNEYALKFLPFIFSIASLFLFYKIGENYFKRKLSVILCLYLFSVNFINLHFVAIFKTYSIEIFITLLSLYYLPNIDIIKMSKKQLIILSSIITALPLISLPSLFFIGIFFMINIFENYNKKEFYKKFLFILVPFISVFAAYYFINLLPTKNMQFSTFGYFWNEVYSFSLIHDITAPIRFLFQPNNYILFIFIIICCFYLYVIFNKKEHTKFNFYLCLSLIFLVISSQLNIYPVLIGRTTVFVIPVLCIILVKFLDVLSPKSLFFYVISVFFAIGTFKYFTPSYLKLINNAVPTFIDYSPKSLIMKLEDSYNDKTDEIVVNEASLYSFNFYKYKTKFNVKDIHMPPFKTYEDRRKTLYKYYNSLNPNKKYWFYLIKEFNTYPERIHTIDWLEKQNILYYIQDKDSYLYYISGIKKVNY